MSVLSAGEAHVSHPTQGLLDALTIAQRKQRFDGPGGRDRRRHPPLARGALRLARARAPSASPTCASSRPPALMPEAARVRRLHAPHRARRRARRRRRRDDAAHPEGAHGRRPTCRMRTGYFAAVRPDAASACARPPDAIVMHPQPMNRGIEIASDVADGPQSVIRDQVRNGVAVRMAVLGGSARPAAAARGDGARRSAGTAAPSSSRTARVVSQTRLRRRAVRAAPGGAEVRRARAARQLRAPDLRCRHPHAPAAVDHARRRRRRLDRDPLQGGRAGPARARRPQGGR